MAEQRWTLVNESDYLFAHLSYEGPPIQPGERVEVVPAAVADRLAEALSYYADRDLYDYDETCVEVTPRPHPLEKDWHTGVLGDGGQVARSALLSYERSERNG